MGWQPGGLQANSRWSSGTETKKSGLAKSAQRTSESSPALQCWEPVGNVPQSVQRTTDKSSTGTALPIQPSVSRTVACDRADPTDESVIIYLTHSVYQRRRRE